MRETPRRRWFQFGLRTMFVVVTVAAVFGWLGWNLKQVRERAIIRRSLDNGGDSGNEYLRRDTEFDSEIPTGELPWLWKQFGARPEGELFVRHGRDMSDTEVERIQHLFPEAAIWHQPRGSSAYIRFIKK